MTDPRDRAVGGGLRCPDGWRPGCTCHSLAYEPEESCPVHGVYGDNACAYCGQFKKIGGACKRCGYQEGGTEALAPTPDGPK